VIRVLQASAWYPPQHFGGTEVYVSGLVRELRQQSVSSSIVKPSVSDMDDAHEFEGSVVRTYSVNDHPSRAELRGDMPHKGFRRFQELLLEENPDVYHQHSWTRGLGYAHLHAARAIGLKTVLSVHVPSPICLRGTMMRFGNEACDGRIDPPACGACWAHSRGAPKSIARVLGALPVSDMFLGRLPEFGPSNRLLTALSARALGDRRREEFGRMIADADRVVAVCGWLFDALRENGVPSEKLVLNRHGVDGDFALQVAGKTKERAADGQFRLLYLGRWDRVKGIDIVVRAVRKISKDVPLTLCIHGVDQNVEERNYKQEVALLAGRDPRITIEPAVPREHLARTLAEADALVVPSQWLETGPLVVLEAKAAGVPIIGSRLGGIAELVSEPEDGILVPAGDVKAWSSAIKEMMKRKPRHRGAASNVRTMSQVASEMAELYRSLH
jgi:glycosyltransferase involved in cell wall biosynthesis